MSTSPFGGDDQSSGLVPLFNLAPDDHNLTRQLQPAVPDRAVLARSNLFGYDCRLDGDPATRPRTLPTYSDGRRKKRAVSLVVVAMLAAAVGVIATQPSARDAADRLFGGGNSAAPAAATPSPTGQVLPITTQAPSDPTPTPVPTTTPSSILPVVGASPSASAAPSATATPSSTTSDQPVYVTGTYSGTAMTACNGARIDGKTCLWQVTVNPGQSVYLQLGWSGGDTMQLIASTSTGAIISTQTLATGEISMTVNNPPSPTIVTVAATGPTLVNFTLGIGDQKF